MSSILIIIALSAFPPSPFAAVGDEPAARSAKAVITDQFGNPVPITRDSATGLVVFSARKSVRSAAPGSVKWTVRPEEYNARKWVPNPDGLEFGIALEGQPVTLMVILSVAGEDGSVDHLVLDMKCGKGGQPPPVPPKPDPEPEPTPVAKSLRLVVVEDNVNRKPETAAVLNARAWWDGLSNRGHRFAVVAENTPSAVDGAYVKRVYSHTGKAKLATGDAYVVIENSATLQTLDVVPLESTAALDVLIKKYTGGK